MTAVSDRGLILALETSTRRGSVALWADGAALFDESFSADRSHNSQVFGSLRRALDEARSRGLPVARIVVGTGPGSNTGTRVAIAAAQGVAMVFGVPLAGLPSLVAAACDDDSYAVVGDARRGSYFVARVEQRTLVGSGPELADRAGLERRLEEFARHAFPVLTFDPSPPIDGAKITPSYPGATRLAQAAARSPFPSSQGVAIEPLYLQAPFVTTPRPPV